MNFARRVLHNILRLVTLQAHTEAINLLAMEVRVNSNLLADIHRTLSLLANSQPYTDQRRVESDRISAVAIANLFKEAHKPQ